MTTGKEKAFGEGLVDGVDDVIKPLVENFGSIALAEKSFETSDLAVWIDRFDAACHGGSFLSANFTIHCVELAVDVGDADFIEVDHGDATNAGAGKGLDRP